MKNFKKVIASLTSAAMVFGMVSLTPMSSVAAVTLPDLDPESSWPQYAIANDGQLYDWTHFPQDKEVILRIDAPQMSVDEISINSTDKTITFKNLSTSGLDLQDTQYTLIFEGTSNVIGAAGLSDKRLFFENGDGAIKVLNDSSLTFKAETVIPVRPASGVYTADLSISVGTNSTITIEEGAFITPESSDENCALTVTLDSDTVSSKALTVETKTYTKSWGDWDVRGVHGPITFTNKNSSTISDDEEETTSADETDDSTTGDTTDGTDDATTDDTTSDDTSDDEATTGDSSDNETESPNVIEGKNLSWNTVDSTGKSYWYENGVKQGTVDDPKAVSYDGAVRGREIYDPESMEWYWLDANANGARAVNKEVFVPYIYQDQSKLNANEIMALAKQSDGGLDGVGGTVYSAIINKTGKWIRYDAKGAMIKGWYTVEGADAELYPTQKGNTYYYDTKTGTMAKGDCVIDGVLYHFDGLTGALKK